MRHDLFIYEDDAGLLERMVPFLRAGLADGESVVVTLERRKWELLADELGSDADVISYIDRDSFYTRPETALAGYDRRLRWLMRDGASAVRVFGELPRCDTETQWNLWLIYEAILNRAFMHQPGRITCGYDLREVPEPLLEGAFETHSEVLTDGWAPSTHYRPPEDVVRSRIPAAVPLAGLHPLRLDGRAPGFRASLSAALSAAAVTDREAESMLVAAGEVFANAQRHGGGTLSVKAGRVGDQFVCEVSDEGTGITDPLAGFLPPRPEDTRGAGLWVARQLTRQVEFLPSPHGMTVRLWI
jgi:anti-sigma regulatory factor (Ser/Thr protein kinase)